MADQVAKKPQLTGLTSELIRVEDMCKYFPVSEDNVQTDINQAIARNKNRKI